MARDVMYYFDKKSPYQRHELGEIQSDFNMSIVIDGSKDSMTIQVFGFEKNELSPNTILYHNATQTWWVVKRDIVKRNANEKDFYYTHNLTFNGAIDLFSSRDFTDCGFNDDFYTIDTFIKRLFKLSTVEFNLTINYGNNIDKDKVVDYIKSFENYNILSALREFLNGYNCDAKLEFETRVEDNKTYISGAILNIIPRTGNLDYEPVNISEFDDIRETKTINKESYGTTVISNAQNVTSTLAKVYPQVGGMRLRASAYEATPENAFLELPTPIFKVNSIKLRHSVTVEMTITIQNSATESYGFTPWNVAQVDKVIKRMANVCANYVYNNTSGTPEEREQRKEETYNRFIANQDRIIRVLDPASTITLKTGWKFNPINKTFVAPSGDDDYHFCNIRKSGASTTPVLDNDYLLIGTKEDHDSIHHQIRCMYYERGDNKINCFDWMSDYNAGAGANITIIRSWNDTDLGDGWTNTLDSQGRFLVFNWGDLYPLPIVIGFKLSVDFYNKYALNVGNTYFQVEYLPMSDLKIKYDNSRNDIDTQLYNQNGKINDSVALGKLVDSYSKEIQSDTITRYMHYTNMNDIPKIGTIVNNEGQKYVINNISYDFSVNEPNNDSDVGYYIECEFTMSKFISTKSLMVNPNSNIRDYGIPQKYNVKRRQTYRDYFEFSLTPDVDANQDEPYVQLDNYLTFGFDATPREYDHTAVIKIDYDNEVDGHLSWYYQLNSTAYVLSKSIYEVIDFKDNNIIGYDMQNTTSGFNMNRLFDNQYRVVTTPVSYVDLNGRVKGITLEMVNKENIQSIYESQVEYSQYDGYIMLSDHPFTGEETFYGKYQNQSFVDDAEGRWTTDISGTGTLPVYFPKPEGYIQDSCSVTNIVAKDRYGNVLSSATVNVDSITEEESYGVDSLKIQFSYDMGTNNTYGTLEFKVHYQKSVQIYQGAIDLKDYEIKELDYGKDAIEVPVFQYILQIGDTEEVEIGDRILETGKGVLSMYNAIIKDRYSTSQLNVNQFFKAPLGEHSAISVDDYTDQINVKNDLLNGIYVADMSLEQNNTKLRIKLKGQQTATFYGKNNKYDYQESVINQQGQVLEDYILGKDIVIYKTVISNVHYDLLSNKVIIDYKNELMMIIHSPSHSNFIGNDLIVDVNYYKLK